MAENLAALEAFVSLSTQWRYERAGNELTGSRHFWTGLDYAAADAIVRLAARKRKKRKALFAAIREMERAALPVLNGGSPHKGDEPWP